MNVKSTTLLVAAAFLIAAAIFLAADQLYFMGAVMVAIALVAWLAVGFSMRGLRCERLVADRVFEEDFISVALTISNPSSTPKFLLCVEEQLSPWLETEEARFLIPVLWPGQKVELSYHARALKRGLLPVGPLRVETSDPIGLFARSKELGGRSEAVVYPLPLEMPPHDLEGAVSFGGGTAERMARAGEGLDFHGIRDYQPGDELRRIHWKATARHQRLAVIEFQQSYTADIAILLDLLRGTDVGEGKETTLEYAVKIAASLARRALDNSAIVTFGAISAEGLQTATCRKEDEFHRLLELLAKAEANGEAPISSLLEAMRPMLHSGTAVILITADPNPRIISSARFLLSEHINPTAILLALPTFAEAQKPAATPAALIGSRIRQNLSQTKLQATAPYASVLESLRQIGAKGQIISQGDDLSLAVRRTIGGVE